MMIWLRNTGSYLNLMKIAIFVAAILDFYTHVVTLASCFVGLAFLVYKNICIADNRASVYLAVP